MNLGILKKENKKWVVVDEFKILKYFPGYQKNHVFWNNLINKNLDFNNFCIGDGKNV